MSVYPLFSPLVAVAGAAFAWKPKESDYSLYTCTAPVILTWQAL